MTIISDNSTIIPVLIGGILSLFGSYLAINHGAKKALEKEYFLKSLDIMEKLELRENVYDILWDETSKINKMEDLNLDNVNNLSDILKKIIETKKLMLYFPLNNEISKLYSNLLKFDIKSKKERKNTYKQIKYLNYRIKMIISYITYNPNKFGALERIKLWLMMK